MAQEFDPMFGGRGETDYAEHSRQSKSKKVISGPLFVPTDPMVPTKTIDPIAGTLTPASASLTLLRNRAYRVVSSVNGFFRLTFGASTALVGDIYLPANLPIVVTTERFDTLSAISDGGSGKIQAVEVQ